LQRQLSHKNVEKHPIKAAIGLKRKSRLERAELEKIQ
jgi:hypothetical protein